MLKALSIDVYRNAAGYDSTNGGITSKYNTLLLVCDRGNVLIDENNLPENLVKLVTRNLFGQEYKHIEPYAPVKKGCVGYMYGGNIAVTSDSRFPSSYPLKVHDRVETMTEYEMLSR